MKNIHILPTDKPSRLVYIGGTSNKYHLLNYNDNKNYKSFNIYITNSEEIKVGEYGLSKLNEVIKFHSGYDYRYYAKIILTTDQDLIKDGVQSIPDEFLEWFVNNPSCEEVEVKMNQGRYFDFGGNVHIVNAYKIIIPKEHRASKSMVDYFKSEQETILESKQEEPKQETLEEAALKKYDYSLFINEEKRPAFIEGAKWQQEQDKNKYSEEDMRKAIQETITLMRYKATEFREHENTVIKQFKKK